MATTHQTFCRNCTHSCGLLVTVEADRVLDVKPDRDHPITEGYFCIKALANAELHGGGGGRLAHSVRRGADGSFEAVEAFAAIAEAGDRLRAILDEHGPRSVGIYMGTGGYFNSLVQPLAKAWLHEVGSPNFFTSSTVDQSAGWVAMMRMGFVASGKPNPAEVDALMIVGANPLVSHWLPAFNPSKRLREWGKRGQKTIIVDPRRSETARMADIHLQLTPGEDVTLFAGMVRLLLERGWEDRAFCERYVGGTEALRRAVEPYSPGYVEERAGVPRDLLEEAVRVFATSGRSLVITGTGICMGPRSNLAMHLATALNVLCGGLRRPGDLVDNPGVMMPRRFTDAVVAPQRPWASGIQCHGVPTGRIYGEIPTGALPDEILTPGPDKLRALIVLGGNPVKALGQPAKTLRAFRDLDLLVSVDVRLNDTARLADYVIAAALPFERHDVPYIFDGLSWASKPFAQYAAPLVAPPPGVIDETLFFWALARRMSLSLEYRRIGLSMAYEDAPPGLALDMKSPPDPERFARWWLDGSTVDFDALKAAPGGIVPDLPEQRVEPAPDDGTRLDLCPADVAEELAAALADRRDPARPYRLATRRLLETMNSAYRDSASAARRWATNPAFMNPDDMADEALSNGDRIEVASRHGALTARVQADKGVRRGMIAMAHCWGEADAVHDPQQRRGAFTGRLVSLDEDIEPINRMPIQTGFPVSIERCAKTAAGPA
ncbi:molybdopterin-containing oxidoreductase family protein [Sphingomonas sp.]|uniref:molybdopterin-containing oxidoreductase family protein n=1 Tax=Sphingomonas sp. TaxID=28214 RepID=UPI003AFF63E4